MSLRLTYNNTLHKTRKNRIVVSLAHKIYGVRTYDHNVINTIIYLRLKMVGRARDDLNIRSGTTIKYCDFLTFIARLTQ